MRQISLTETKDSAIKKIKQGLKKEKERQKQKEQEENKIKSEMEIKEAEFKKYYKLGSTTVYVKNNKFYFYGDIPHCKKEPIFHNAKEMKRRMEKNKTKYAHMSYNDLPEFGGKYDFKREDQFRIRYGEDLYVFEGDEIKLVNSAKEVQKNKDKIREAVEKNNDELEDLINVKLREVLNKLKIKEDEIFSPIEYARKIFFER